MSRQTLPPSPIPRLALRGYTELAASLGVSEDFARDVLAPEIPSVQRGGKVRLWGIKAVEAWLSENEHRVLDEIKRTENYGRATWSASGRRA